jgi:PEP-CTERM motif-containing protein
VEPTYPLMCKYLHSLPLRGNRPSDNKQITALCFWRINCDVLGSGSLSQPVPKGVLVMKMRLVLGVIVVLATFSVCAVADLSGVGAPPPGGQFEVEFLGTFYCVSQTGSYCPDFADWGGTAGGYVEFKAPGGAIDAYLWVDGTGELSFASGSAIVTPPAGLPLLGVITEDGKLDEVDEDYPGGVERPLYVESPTVPEPSTLLLFGPAAVFLFKRARRFGRF